MIKINSNRILALDIETTGMNKNKKFYENHRIIEIGIVEIINRELTGNNFHVYINPNRLIQLEAFKIHGISDSFLLNKPYFSDIFIKFIKYIKNSELIIHNADFDVGFLNYEIKKLKLDMKDISEVCKITDTLKIARSSFPGKKNNLDALRKRYKIHLNEKLHSAIIDATILAKVYLRMTSMQTKIIFNDTDNKKIISNRIFNKKNKKFIRKPLLILRVQEDEQIKHEKYIKNINKN